MTRLNFPVINQRITVLSDGTRDPNADYDCVPECDAGILEYYSGRHFEGGVLKELVYGRNYRGGTDEAAYVALMAHYGVKVYPIGGKPDALVILAHGHIKAGHPIIITEPDPYMPDGSGYTHVIVLYEEHAGGVTAMDPFIARDVVFSDAQLAMHLAVKEIWIAESIGKDDIVSISLTTPGVADRFKAGAGNAWICLKNGYIIHDGMLNFYRTMGGALAGLTQAGLPLSNERKPKQPEGMSINEYNQILLHHPEITEQEFERLILRYDPNKIMDNPPGSGSVYTIHLVPVPDVSSLQGDLDVARKQVADLNARIQVAVDALKA
jgi:hypothetical protein